MTFEELYEDYFDDIYRFSFWLSGNKMMAEDISSETFIRAWTKLNRIRTETLKGYLLAIARNIYIDELRKNKKYVDYEEEELSPKFFSEKSFEDRQQLERIRGLMMSYPETDRTAFILRTEEGLPYDEIARIMQISLASVKVKIHRVRKKLIKDRLTMEGK